MSKSIQNDKGKQRIYAYDNLKFVLILFVVIGHFSDQLVTNLYGEYGGNPSLPVSELFNKIFLFIYAFHMPLFIFLSGLFYKVEEKFDGAKPARYIILGLLLKMLLYLSMTVFRTDYNKDNEMYFNLIGGDGVF